LCFLALITGEIIKLKSVFLITALQKRHSQDSILLLPVDFTIASIACVFLGAVVGLAVTFGRSGDSSEKSTRSF